MTRIMYGAAMLLLGIIAGAVIVNVMVGKQIDQLYFHNSELKHQLTATEKELLQWRNNEDGSQRVVTKIDASVNFLGNHDLSEYEKESIQLAVDKKIKEWLQVLMGQPVDTINYPLIPIIIDGRQLEIEGVLFQLQVNLMVISEHILVHLKVIPIKNHDKPVLGRVR